MIITKSISRFARNTITLLETVRQLKEIGVDIYFEKENIHTVSSTGELMLTVLASFAQEESLSVSENMKWRVRKNFEEGKPWNYTMYGYRNVGGILTIVPEEAEIIKDIYRLFLSNTGLHTIAKMLNERKIMNRYGKVWSKETVKLILRNYAYTGNLILQTTFIENHLTKRKIYNKGEKPKYLVENSHEPIITVEEYEKAQAELDRRANKYSPPGKPKQLYPFSGKLTCDKCGDIYRRKTTATQHIWVCTTYNSKGKSLCSSKAVPEKTLMAASGEVLGTDDFDENLFAKKISRIIVKENNTLDFILTDGVVVTRQWKDRSRSESWTDEMRQKAHRKEMERQGKINVK